MVMAGSLSISPDVLARELAGEILVLDLRTSLYFGMTGTAARIWQLAEAGESRDGMIAALASEFDASPQTVAGDVDAFLSDLVARGLLVNGQQ